MTTREASRLWNIPESDIVEFCENLAIRGAELRSGRWFVPASADPCAVFPPAYMEETPLSLPVGVGGEDFRTFSSSPYYVDKTLLIRDITDRDTRAYYFTRPRGFGKTLNLNMLRAFFERTEEDSSVWFVDKKIWTCKPKYRKHQGQYPVVWLTFRDARYDNWEDTRDHLCDCLSREICRHKELLESDRCCEFDREWLRRLADRSAEMRKYGGALSLLTEMLHAHYGVPAILMIDDLDTPVRSGDLHGYGPEVTDFLGALLSGALKDSLSVRFAFLTGVLQGGMERVFADLNNLRDCGVLSPWFSQYFGFTADEVREMAAACHAEDRLDEFRKRYDSYVFGNTEVYPPWPVSNFFSEGCGAGAY